MEEKALIRGRRQGVYCDWRIWILEKISEEKRLGGK